MFGKIKNLEEQVNLSEQTRNEMREKLRVAEDGNRDRGSGEPRDVGRDCD